MMKKLAEIRQKSLSLSSLESDVEETFYDARDSNLVSPRKTPNSIVNRSMVDLISQANLDMSCKERLRKSDTRSESEVYSKDDIAATCSLTNRYQPNNLCDLSRSLSERHVLTGSSGDLSKKDEDETSHILGEKSYSHGVPCVRSMSDITEKVKDQLNHGGNPFKCESNSSSRESLSANSISASHFLTPPRSTLHKSVSTPSILAAQEASEEVSIGQDKREVNISIDVTQESDDEKSLSKPKKRGSLFFRKRKGKKDEKESKKSAHQFVTVCYSTAALCDVCKKALANKPAVKCEICLVTVHDNNCKEQILDCNKFRLAKKPSHLALNTKEKTLSPMLQVPPAGNSRISSPTHNQKERRLTSMSFTKAHPASQSMLSSTDYSLSIGKAGSSSSPSKVISEDKELETGDESNIVDTNSTSLESLDEGLPEINDLDNDPLLKLMEEEPEAWSATVDKKLLKKLKEKEIKRQEAIYELIITEKHHCLTLKIMQKIFAEGMVKELNLKREVERIFPCLEELLEAHLSFLRRLRERQMQNSVIENIGDVILQQFAKENGDRMERCYSQFCSHHKDAVSLYKDILKTDRKFQNFVKRYSSKPLCKARGIPECILLVTQRITKYPLLIDSLIKATKDSVSDYDDLLESMRSVKYILNKIDARVADKEREDRLLAIYNKIEAKSTAGFRNQKFRKSDLLSNNRKLRYEGVISWKSARGKNVDVIAIILSDVIIFLQESNQKYHFVSLDNKSGVVPLQKLLVRQKAGQYSKGIYLISSDPSAPEMYELICTTAREQKAWIEQIRQAVDNCPDEDDTRSGAEREKVNEAKRARFRQFASIMRENDLKLAQLCEEKMKILAEAMELRGTEYEGPDYLNYASSTEEKFSAEAMYNAANEAFRISHSLYVSGVNLNRSVSSVGEHQSETLISPVLPKRAETFGGFDTPIKSQSSGKGPTKKKSFHCEDCELDESADGSATVVFSDTAHNLTTDVREKEEIRRFSGPLVEKVCSPEKTHRRSLVGTPSTSSGSSHQQNQSALTSPCAERCDIRRLSTTSLLSCNSKDQLIAITELQHHINLMICFFNYQQSLLVNMKCQIAEGSNKLHELQRESSITKHDRRTGYRPEHQLEELRNIQEQLTSEKSDWQKRYTEEKYQLEKEKEQLQELQEQIKQEQKDLTHQRELLYRKLEALQKEGIILSPAHTVVNIGANSKAFSGDSSLNTHVHDQGPITNANDSKFTTPTGLTSSASVKMRNVTSINISSKDSNQDLPVHLCSTTNMITKRNVGTNVSIKQQLPLKLAASNSITSPNTTPTITFTISQPQQQQQQQQQQQSTSSIVIPNGIPKSSAAVQNVPSQQMLPLKLASESKSATTGATAAISCQPSKNVGPTSDATAPCSNNSASTQSPPNGTSKKNPLKPITSSTLPSSHHQQHHHIRTRSSPAHVQRTEGDAIGENFNANVSQRRRKSTDEEIFC